MESLHTCRAEACACAALPMRLLSHRLHTSPASSGIAHAGGRCSHLRVHRRALAAAAAAAHTPPPDHSSAQAPKKRLAVFVSGGGSNFRAIHAATQQGAMAGEVAVVVSNAPACGGCEYARQHGIPTLTYPAPKDSPGEGLGDEELVQQLTLVGMAAGQPRPPLLP